MSKGESRNKKEEYFNKLSELFTDYSTSFIVNVDNVGSNQMHQIRHSLRGEAVVLMGKNTMVRRALRVLREDRPELERLLPAVKGNVGFVFTKSSDLKKIRDAITSNRVQAPAKAGAIAPVDVFVPGGNTGMGPEKTSFFQALGIATKISRGTIEILNDVHLIKVGSKVGASEAALLNMLNISPFTYGMSITQVYDNGTMFAPEILDVEESTLVEYVIKGITSIAAVSLQIHYPTVAAVPHVLINGYKNLIAVSLVSDYVIDGAKKVRVFNFLLPVFFCSVKFHEMTLIFKSMIWRKSD